jgi:hypothetical protein
MNSIKNRRGASLKSLEDDEFSLSGSNGTYYDSEDDMDYKPTAKRLRSFDSGKKSESKIQRKPTRIPDSKVTNRNALLARENRKRKKEIMETMEQTCGELEAENKRLLKMMKFKDAREKKLLREIQYLKSVIVSRTEIVSVLKSLPQLTAKPQAVAAAARKRSVEQQSMECKIKQENAATAFASKASSVTLSTYSASDIEDGTKQCDDPFLPAIIDEFLFTDLHLDVATEWDEILQNPFSSATDFTDIPKLDEISILSPPASSPLSDMSTDHNYSHLEDEVEKLSDHSDNDAPGVCIHVRRGKISLEFCSVCHYNATNAWVENIN